MKKPNPFCIRERPTDERLTEVAFLYYDRWEGTQWCVGIEGMGGMTMEEAEELSKWLAECVAYSREKRKK